MFHYGYFHNCIYNVMIIMLCIRQITIKIRTLTNHTKNNDCSLLTPLVMVSTFVQNMKNNDYVV